MSKYKNKIKKRAQVSILFINYSAFKIFGLTTSIWSFQNNFRPKNLNFQNWLAFGLVLLGNFENFNFLVENYSENFQKIPNFEACQKFVNALYHDLVPHPPWHPTHQDPANTAAIQVDARENDKTPVHDFGRNLWNTVGIHQVSRIHGAGV